MAPEAIIGRWRTYPCATGASDRTVLWTNPHASSPVACPRYGRPARPVRSAPQSLHECSGVGSRTSARSTRCGCPPSGSSSSRPTASSRGCKRSSLRAWRPIAEELVDVIHGVHPDALVFVSGVDWGYDLSGVVRDPVERPNVIYETHPHLGKGERRKTVLDELRKAAPVFIGEWGFTRGSSERNLRGTAEGYAGPSSATPRSATSDGPPGGGIQRGTSACSRAGKATNRPHSASWSWTACRVSRAGCALVAHRAVPTRPRQAPSPGGAGSAPPGRAHEQGALRAQTSLQPAPPDPAGGGARRPRHQREVVDWVMLARAQDAQYRGFQNCTTRPARITWKGVAAVSDQRGW